MFLAQGFPSFSRCSWHGRVYPLRESWHAMIIPREYPVIISLLYQNIPIGDPSVHIMGIPLSGSIVVFPIWFLVVFAGFPMILKSIDQFLSPAINKSPGSWKKLGETVTSVSFGFAHGFAHGFRHRVFCLAKKSPPRHMAPICSPALCAAVWMAVSSCGAALAFHFSWGSSPLF